MIIPNETLAAKLYPKYIIVSWDTHYIVIVLIYSSSGYTDNVMADCQTAKITLGNKHTC